jgi:hypothetical protein
VQGSQAAAGGDATGGGAGAGSLGKVTEGVAALDIAADGRATANQS